MDQLTKIKKFIQSYPNTEIAILNISSGILVKRIVQGNKVKFKVADEKNLIPKDHLNIFNICKKKYPVLLQPTFEHDNEMFFLFISPYHAHIIENYKEDLLFISFNKKEIPDKEYFEKYCLKQAVFTQNLINLDEGLNYLIFSLEKTKIISSEIFYCDQYKEYLDALKEATFGNFLTILREENIKNEKSFISYLAKNGIPELVQNKYLEFWKDYNHFLDIIDDICLELQRQEIDLNQFIEIKRKDVQSSLISYLKYDIEKAYGFLEELKDN
jgi:hypothetical protein